MASDRKSLIAALGLGLGALAQAACGIVVSFDDYGVPTRHVDASVDGSPAFVVRGTAVGLDGRVVTATLGAEQITIADGPFASTTRLADGSDYRLVLGPHPLGRVCATVNPSGRITGQDANVAIQCHPASARLKSLKIMSGSLDPPFSPDTFNYVSALPAWWFSGVYPEPVTEDPDATWTVPQSDISSPSHIDNWRLPVAIDVIVTAPDHLTKVDYHVVARPDTAHYLKASNARAGASFGSAVAAVGSDSVAATIVVGAPGESSGGSGIGANQNDTSAPNAGAAYIFQRSDSAWSQSAYVKSVPVAAGAKFGSAVAMSGDAVVVVVGAPEEPGGGAAYVFRRTASGWSQEARLVGSGVTIGAKFGSAVSIPLSATSIAIGASGELDGAGAAYVFLNDNGSWVEQARLTASNARAGAELGASISLAGDWLAIGSPGESSAATGVDGDSSDGAISGAGAAYVFHRSGSIWSSMSYLKGSKVVSGGRFGASVARYTDAYGGEHVLVGWPGDQAIAFFVCDATWPFWKCRLDSEGRPPVGTPAPGFGSAVNMSNERAIVGAPAADVAQVPGTYGPLQGARMLGPPTTATKTRFGASVAFTGYLYVVGAPDEASATKVIDGDATDTSAPGAGAVWTLY